MTLTPDHPAPHKKVFDNFIFLEEQNLVFGYVPKVACTNWKILIRRLQGHSDYQDKSIAHDRKLSGFRFLDHKSETDNEILKDKNVRKIAFVRNPYTRVLSAYLDKIDRINKKANTSEHNSHFVRVHADIRKFRDASLKRSWKYKVFGRFTLPKDDYVDFITFLTWIKETRSFSGFSQDEHWTPQSEILKYPSVNFDFLGRFENLENDAKVALEMMGANFNFPSQSEIGFKSTGASAQISQYFRTEHIQLVDELFSLDFDAYGYKRGELT